MYNILNSDSRMPGSSLISANPLGFPGGSDSKEFTYSAGDPGGWIPWRREWLPTPVFLPGEFHGQRSLAGYSPWGHKESDMTEAS